MKPLNQFKHVTELLEYLLEYIDYYDEQQRPIGIAYDKILAIALKQFPDANTKSMSLRYIVHKSTIGDYIRKLNLPYWRPRVNSKGYKGTCSLDYLLAE